MAGWGSSRVAACGPWGCGGGGVALERELSRDGSHYSISGGILPSLGARSNRRVKLRPFIVSPYDRRYRFAAPPSPFYVFFFFHTSTVRVRLSSPLPSRVPPLCIFLISALV